MMSRRMDREGMCRMQLNGIVNERFWADPRCKENERGWVEPFAVWQGWQELNRAIWYTHYRLVILADLLSDYERKDIIHRVRYCLTASAKCDRPNLP